MWNSYSACRSHARTAVAVTEAVALNSFIAQCEHHEAELGIQAEMEGDAVTREGRPRGPEGQGSEGTGDNAEPRGTRTGQDEEGDQGDDE